MIIIFITGITFMLRRLSRTLTRIGVEIFSSKWSCSFEILPTHPYKIQHSRCFVTRTGIKEARGPAASLFRLILTGRTKNLRARLLRLMRLLLYMDVSWYEQL